MKEAVIKDDPKEKHAMKPVVLTIGNFDGVHLGHRKLIQTCQQIAKVHDLQVTVLTFFPHPIEVLRPELGHQRLFSLEDQQQVMTEIGVDHIFVQEFTKVFATLSASDFLQQIVQKFQPSHIVVGDDFGFGAKKSGNLSVLQDFCHKSGIELTIVPEVDWKGQRVSSSLIKNKIREGDFDWVNEALSRPFYLQGTVVKGDQRGRQLGFPTANLGPFHQVVPKSGVYITRMHLRGKWWPSVTNVGINKTFYEEGSIKIETHVLNFSEQFYDEVIKVSFLKYLREEKKFSGFEELKAQIFLDRDQAKEFHDKNS